MMDKNEIIKDIIDIEWDMFSQVQNVGGKASCQGRPDTFEIMRKSQMSTWSIDLLQSWFNDLKDGQESGNNLMSLKYAYMMENTHPAEFQEIKDQLPEISSDVLKMIDEIVKIHIAWKKDLNEKYPMLASRGRPISNNSDNMGWASLETYMRSELKTYSAKTISIYHKETMQRVKENKSEAAENLLNQVKEYGFSSLLEAENKLAKKS